jgi:hypothetical protein
VMQTLQDIHDWYQENESLFAATAYPASTHTIPAPEPLREIAS